MEKNDVKSTHSDWATTSSKATEARGDKEINSGHKENNGDEQRKDEDEERKSGDERKDGDEEKKSGDELISETGKCQ